MNVLPQLKPASDPVAGDARRAGLGTALAQASSNGGDESNALEVRIKSLKILALTLLREIEYLEVQNVTGGSPRSLDLRAEVQHFEAELIRSALIRTGGRQRQAARLLGLKATTINSKVQRYRIETKEMSDESQKQPKGRGGKRFRSARQPKALDISRENSQRRSDKP